MTSRTQACHTSNRIGKKKNTPGKRNAGVHQLGRLKNPTAIVTVGKRSKINRKK